MERFKKVIFVFFAFFLMLHLCFTFIYNFDKVTTNPTIRFVVFKYMFPFFNQNNKIFAPDPPFCKQQLLIKYRHKNGMWTEYQNPQLSMLEQHVGNRLSPIGTHIKHYDYILRHIYDAHIYAEYYMNNSKSMPENKDSVRLTYLIRYDGFNMAQRYFSDLINKNTKGSSYDSLKFELRYIYPEKYKAKAPDEIKSTELKISFPALPILKNYVAAE
jgi:hypothetical protein